MIRTYAALMLAALALASCGPRTGTATTGAASSSKDAVESANGGNVGGVHDPAVEHKQTPTGPTVN